MSLSVHLQHRGPVRRQAVRGPRRPRPRGRRPERGHQLRLQGKIRLARPDVHPKRDADPRPAMHDLAKGTGGDYRYLLLERNAAQAAKVTAVALLRLAKEMHSRPAGWDGNTPDINKGRGGTYLYLLWKTGAAA